EGVRHHPPAGRRGAGHLLLGRRDEAGGLLRLAARGPLAPHPATRVRIRRVEMKVRLGLALLVLIGPLAVAPAPLPRRERGSRSDEISLASFQGSWRITKRFTLRANGQHVPMVSSVTHIRIVEDRWTFMSNASEGSTLEIAVDPRHKPAL